MQAWYLKAMECYRNFMGISIVFALGQDRGLVDSVGILSDVEMERGIKGPKLSAFNIHGEGPRGLDCTN